MVDELQNGSVPDVSVQHLSRFIKWSFSLSYSNITENISYSTLQNSLNLRKIWAILWSEYSKVSKNVKSVFILGKHINDNTTWYENDKS